jgi:hypothetical protein
MLIAVHLAEGNPYEALRQYRWYERILHEELRLAPSTQIMALVSDLLAARRVRKCVHAARRYSCRRPPSRSCRCTRAR